MTKTQKTRLFDVLIISSAILVVHFIVTAVNAHSTVHSSYKGIHQQTVPQHQLDTISVYEHCSDLYDKPEEWNRCIVKAAENAGMKATTTDSNEEVMKPLLVQEYDR